MPHLLRSTQLSALGVSHGFNLRTGGVSQAPFASFNLARSVGDEPALAARNHELFAASVGFAPGRLFETSQVHGSAVRVVRGTEEPARVRAEEADVLATAEPGVAIGVRVADCVALLIADRARGVVGAVHAGWRGVVARAPEIGVRQVLALGGAAHELVVAIFPHIRACCFEVGEDVASELQSAAPGMTVVQRPRERPHIDLASIVRAQLVDAGVLESRVDDIPGCTRCEPERFFSFRREGQRSGRHIAAIVAP
jgi:YfiH family protein